MKSDRPQRPPSPSRDTRLGWIAVALLAGVCIALALVGDAARGWGRYERDALELGEHWRLVTAHLVHLGWGHLWMNVAALVLIRALFDDLLGVLEWLAAILVSAAAIDAGLYFWQREIAWYVGLSGVLHGLLAFGALRLLEVRALFAAVLLGALGVKLTLEQLYGALPWSGLGAGGPVIVAAHLYGAAGGALTALGAKVLRVARGRSL